MTGLARLAIAGALLVTALAHPVRADDFDGGSVVFARGAALYRIDAGGRGEAAIAELPAKATVRALRTDATGKVLLVDLAGRWAWLPLDGSTRTLIDLPCADGPAQLAEDGSRVLCRSPAAAGRSIIVELIRGGAAPRTPTALDVPPTSARLAGDGAERLLVWADADGVWTALEREPTAKTRVSDPPVRGFLASPDGDRAVGVFADQVYADVKHKKAADVLMTLQLDGQGARRKAIRDGVAVEWSHDGQWVLVQDGNSACLMRASGGQYKCWTGYTAASLSSDGRWGLAFGNRDGSRHAAARPAKKPTPPATKKPAKPTRPAAPPDPNDKPWDHIDEPVNEPEAAQASPTDPAGDDISVPPPTGPQALYRLRLEGAFTDKPTLLVKVIDGAAVWIPKAP